MKRFWIPMLLALAGGPLPAADVTGDWKIDGDVSGNPLAMVCSLKQEDVKLSGKCVSDSGGGINSPIAGKVDGKNVSFNFDFQYNGMALNMAFTGTLDSDTAMKGGVEVMGASGSFTAAKKQ